MKATVLYIPDQPNKTPSLVGYFPSGCSPLEGQNVKQVEKDEAPSEEKLKKSEEEVGLLSPRVKVYGNTNEKRHKTGKLELVVSPAGADVEFVGTSYAGEAMAPQFCQYAVGVLDQERQTLKIVPIASNKVSSRV